MKIFFSGLQKVYLLATIILTGRHKIVFLWQDKIITGLINSTEYSCSNGYLHEFIKSHRIPPSRSSCWRSSPQVKPWKKDPSQTIGFCVTPNPFQGGAMRPSDNWLNKNKTSQRGFATTEESAIRNMGNGAKRAQEDQCIVMLRKRQGCYVNQH